jgi:hypothetical protein
MPGVFARIGRLATCLRRLLHHDLRHDPRQEGHAEGAAARLQVG